MLLIVSENWLLFVVFFYFFLFLLHVLHCSNAWLSVHIRLSGLPAVSSSGTAIIMNSNLLHCGGANLPAEMGGSRRRLLYVAWQRYTQEGLLKGGIAYKLPLESLTSESEGQGTEQSQVAKKHSVVQAFLHWRFGPGQWFIRRPASSWWKPSQVTFQTPDNTPDRFDSKLLQCQCHACHAWVHQHAITWFTCYCTTWSLSDWPHR